MMSKTITPKLPLWKKIMALLLSPILLPMALILCGLIAIKNDIDEDIAYFLSAVLTSALFTAICLWWL